MVAFHDCQIAYCVYRRYWEGHINVTIIASFLVSHRIYRFAIAEPLTRMLSVERLYHTSALASNIVAVKLQEALLNVERLRFSQRLIAANETSN